ncbi:hypothetical protein GALMADRAFT_82397 [Galerina marginata CBS 339.88]|uniref:Uncharacterized protein n=1 Tax=Galerina marginata (strain CBS 339.88) TaxID=685588 RepID=A0A067S2I3_GALM3|nr:hypothetical protein GALMADRAFT_82397 [Galerina marginata CBS 339.88]
MYSEETPSEYYIRKSDLLNTVYTLDDSEIILEVMEGAPANWNTILTTQLYLTVVEFQAAIRFHEDTLMRLDGHIKRDLSNALPRDQNTYSPKAYSVGEYFGMPAPKFPRDDANVSNKEFTPEEKGARPCRHCGSEKHWDDECKYSYKAKKSMRSLLVNPSSEQINAQAAYEDLYFGLRSEDEF